MSRYAPMLAVMTILASCSTPRVGGFYRDRHLKMELRIHDALRDLGLYQQTGNQVYLGAFQASLVSYVKLHAQDRFRHAIDPSRAHYFSQGNGLLAEHADLAYDVFSTETEALLRSFAREHAAK